MAVGNKFVRVMFSYVPAEVDELKMDVGDIIEVLAEVEKGWCRGRKADRTVGLFPSNFVQPVEQQLETKVHNSTKVVLSPVECEKLGSPATVHIDASMAGRGDLEVFVSVGPTNLLCEVKQIGKAKFVVTFVPVELTIHTVVVKFNGEFVPGSPINYTPVEMKQTVPAAINESIFVEESSEVELVEVQDSKVEEAAPSQSSKLPVGSQVQPFQANSSSDGYFALAMVTSVTKTDATAITASRRQFPLLATQFQPGQTLKCRGVDLRVYLRPNDPLKLWLERENLIAAVVNTDGYGREDRLSRGVVDSIIPPVGNIWSPTVGNIQFRMDKSTPLNIGDRVFFKQMSSGNGAISADIVGLVAEDTDDMLWTTTITRPSTSTAGKLTSSTSDSLCTVKPNVNEETLHTKDSPSTSTAGFYDVPEGKSTRLDGPSTSARETPVEFSKPTVSLATVSSVPKSSVSLVAAPRPVEANRVPAAFKCKTAQDQIDLLLSVDRQTDFAVTRYSGIGLITTTYQQVARIYCQTGELVPLCSRQFICEPGIPLFELLKPLTVVKYEFEKSYNVDLRKWKEELLYAQPTDDPYPYWDQLEVCDATVILHLESRSYFSGVILKSANIEKMMMPRFANPFSIEDLNKHMPIGRVVKVVVARNFREADTEIRHTHNVIMLAPPGVVTLADLISKAADIHVNRSGRGGFSTSDPPPLVDLREEVHRPMPRPTDEESCDSAPFQPVLWPSEGKVIVEKGVGLVTTVYRRYCQLWIPNRGLHMAHVEGLTNVRCAFMARVVKPLQLVNYTLEWCTKATPRGIDTALVAVAPVTSGLESEVEKFPWNQLRVSQTWVCWNGIDNKRPDANKPGFSAVLLKSAMFIRQVIFMPSYSYPQFTLDLPSILPPKCRLNVIVAEQGIKKGKEVIPLLAIACIPSYVQTIADLKRYVAACHP